MKVRYDFYILFPKNFKNVTIPVRYINYGISSRGKIELANRY